MMAMSTQEKKKTKIHCPATILTEWDQRRPQVADQAFYKDQPITASI